MFHFANYANASVGTLSKFEKFGWGGTTFLTGFIILFAMFMIYSAAPVGWVGVGGWAGWCVCGCMSVWVCGLVVRWVRWVVTLTLTLALTLTLTLTLTLNPQPSTLNPQPSTPKDRVRHALYENFFYAHHFFIIFFFFLLLHGPVFWCWSLIPLGLYACERFLQQFRGSRPFVVLRVEWVKPVMAVKICPLVKSDFDFREGQYLYLNSPYISDYEWHPFTISSARGDLSIPGRGSAMSQMRVSLATGEECVPVPRPKGLDPRSVVGEYTRKSC